ncbi:MAG: DNA starvation/stationary phase protection protein [Bryobacterales bacterium]|nr:DNA starvation/stationary phase protection protein [Bryobacterales bacterium]
MGHEINIGLEANEREGVVALLQHNLADLHVLYIKSRNFHWNVVGPHFAELHGFFEEQYDQLEESIDEVAERIRALGGVATGSMEGFLKLARLSESTGNPPNADAMIAELLADHESIIRQLRLDLDTANDKYHDAGTGDFLTGLMEGHEKMAWMLRAHLAR